MLSAEQELLLLRFDDPDLTVLEREALAALVANEADAQEFLRQLQSLDQQMAKLGVGVDSVDLSGFGEAVNRKIDSTPGLRRFSWKWMAPLSAAAAIAMIALPWFNPPEATEPAVAQVALTQPAEVISAPMSEVAISTAPPTVTDAGSVHVTIGFQPIPMEQNIEGADGEIIFFGGPKATDPPASRSNNTLVY